jgi:hypothetical protein
MVAMLPDSFFAFPAHARTTMPTKMLREVLLATDGQVMSCGRLWAIRSERIGPGVYRVWLERWFADSAAAT